MYAVERTSCIKWSKISKCENIRYDVLTCNQSHTLHRTHNLALGKTVKVRKAETCHLHQEVSWAKQNTGLTGTECVCEHERMWMCVAAESTVRCIVTCCSYIFGYWSDGRKLKVCVCGQAQVLDVERCKTSWDKASGTKKGVYQSNSMPQHALLPKSSNK